MTVENRQLSETWSSSRVTDHMRQSWVAEKTWRGLKAILASGSYGAGPKLRELSTYPTREFDYSVSMAGWLSPAVSESTSRRMPLTLIFDHEVDQEIERASKAILGLEDNWDGEGSSAYSKATLDRAINFLKLHVSALIEESGKITVPRILPGPDGSIDLHWRTAKLELLVNVPPNDGLVSFYGDDFSDGNSVKGTFNLKSVSKHLVSWLIDASG